MPAGEQKVEDDAEGVDIGRGRDGAAGQLFRRRILGRERPRVARVSSVASPASSRLEQLRDAEVEQLHLSVAVDEDVRRLEIAMDDQVGVRVGHSRQHVEKHTYPRLDAECPGVTPAIDAIAFHVFQHEIGLASRRHAGIDQMCDVGVLQPRQNRAFAPESLAAAWPTRAAFRSLIAATPSKLPSLRQASHTLPMPPWPSGDVSV